MSTVMFIETSGGGGGGTERIPLSAEAVREMRTLNAMSEDLGTYSTEPMSVPMHETPHGLVRRCATYATWRARQRHLGRYGDSAADERALLSVSYPGVWICDLPPEEVAALMMTANFLDIPGLLLQCARRLGQELEECRTSAGIRQRFHLPDDLSPQERQAISAEMAYCDDAFLPEDLGVG